MTDGSFQDSRGNDNTPSPWDLESFRVQCADNDWLWLVEDVQLGGPWTEFFGYDFDEVTRDVAQAARLPEDWRGDWMALACWLRDGICPNSMILPVLREAAAQPGYVPPLSLEAFDVGATCHDAVDRVRLTLAIERHNREREEACKLGSGLLEPPF